MMILSMTTPTLSFKALLKSFLPEASLDSPQLSSTPGSALCHLQCELEWQLERQDSPLQPHSTEVETEAQGLAQDQVGELQAESRSDSSMCDHPPSCSTSRECVAATGDSEGRRTCALLPGAQSWRRKVQKQLRVGGVSSPVDPGTLEALTCWGQGWLPRGYNMKLGGTCREAEGWPEPGCGWPS